MRFYDFRVSLNAEKYKFYKEQTRLIKNIIGLMK